MTIDKRPEISIGCHPLEAGRYLLATNEINRLREEVIKWIDNRTPGAIVYGRPRLGKSRAIKYLQYDLPEVFGGKLPIFQVRCLQYKNLNEGVFFGDLLKDVGHMEYLSGKPEVKRDRLIKFLLERGRVSGQHRIILFLDDSQRLHELQYGWLMDIYNELDQFGICLTVILVGQEELIHQRTAFKQSKKTQIIGRFMIHEYQFMGIKTLEDIKSCLAGYDCNCEYPAGSGWSFTRYFFPEAYTLGQRLENSADEVFKAFTTLRQAVKMLSPMEIPMQYLTLTVEYAFRKFGTNGLNVEWLNQANWIEAIENSGYIKAESYQEVI